MPVMFYSNIVLFKLYFVIQLYVYILYNIVAIKKITGYHAWALAIICHTFTQRDWTFNVF